MGDSFAVEVFDPSLLLTNLGTVKRHVPIDRVVATDINSYMFREEDDEASHGEESPITRPSPTGSADAKSRTTFFHRMFHASPTFPATSKSFAPKPIRTAQQQQHDGKEYSGDWGFEQKSGDPTSAYASPIVDAHEELATPAPAPNRAAILRVILTATRRWSLPAASPRDAQFTGDSIHTQLQPSSPVVLLASPGLAYGRIARTKSVGDIASGRSAESIGTLSESSPNSKDKFHNAAVTMSLSGVGRDNGSKVEAQVAEDGFRRISAKDLAKRRGSDDQASSSGSESEQGLRTARRDRKSRPSSPRIFAQWFGAGVAENDEKLASSREDVLREVGNLVERSWSSDRKNPRLNRSNSDCCLSEKYGMCQEILGKGAHAVVQLAHKKGVSAADKLYAVKRFRKRRKSETQKEYIKKLTAEFCIASTLRHENICETVDLVQDENSSWCEVMEYCSGGDLFARMKGEPLNQIEIDCYFKQLIHGVAYLHSMGVAHRDLKPENLLLDASSHILKIADFGISEVFKTAFTKELRKSTGLCGSEPYIAAEEFVSESYFPSPVDIWAAGIVYYTMTYLAIPWHRAEITDTRFASYLDSRRTAQQFWDRVTAAAAAAETGDAEKLSHSDGSVTGTPTLRCNGRADVDAGRSDDNRSDNPGGADTFRKTTDMGGANVPGTLQEEQVQQQTQQNKQPRLHNFPLAEGLRKPVEVNLGPFMRFSPGAAHIVFRMLEPDPKRRWTAHDIKCDPWFANVECCYECHRNEHHGHKIIHRALNEP